MAKQKNRAIETLPKINNRLSELRQAYVDAVVNVRDLAWDNDKLVIRDRQTGFEADAPVSRIALDQMCGLLGVPRTFGRTCPSDVRQVIVNRLLPEVPEGRVFVRLIKRNGVEGSPVRHEARAILPQNFEPFDFTDLSGTILRVAERLGLEYEIDRGADGPDGGLESWNLRLIDPSTAMDVDTPEKKLYLGIDARTSEVGLFNPSIEPVLFQEVCTNGLKIALNGSMNTQILKFRYYKVRPESIVERICAHVQEMLQKYQVKQQQLRASVQSMIPAETAEKLYMDTLVSAHVAGGAKNREELIARLRSNREPNGYNAYRVVSTLTEIARDFSRVISETPERQLYQTDLIERGAGAILNQFAEPVTA